MAKLGRPPLPEHERKSVTIQCRMTEAVYDLLWRMAKRNDRTVSQEITHRLRISLGAETSDG